MAVRYLALTFLSIVIGASAVALAADRPGTLAPGTIAIKGAGATFPAPLYKKWIATYQQQNPAVQISYDAIGSGDGVRLFAAGEVDFGASDAAMNDGQIAQVERGVHMIPVVAGSIVLAYNLPGMEGRLKLPRDVYLDIFLNKITTWNDPRLVAANPDLALPRATIALVVRQDSSGTTFAFTNHLSAISEEWRDRGPGVGTVIDWPGSAMVARGNEGVAGRIKQSYGALGYVEYGMAQRTGLQMAHLENKAGQFIPPDGNSGMATLTSVVMPDNLRAFFPDPDGPNSYSIVTFSWLLLYNKYPDTQKAAALKHYVKWCLTEGQTFNEALGYVRLAPNVVAQATQAVDRIQ
jgi:phosphate transport system substrate-binding protein